MNRREFLKSLAVAYATGVSVAESRAADATEPSSKSRLPRRQLGKTGVEVSALGLGGVIGCSSRPKQTHERMMAPCAASSRA